MFVTYPKIKKQASLLSKTVVERMTTSIIVGLKSLRYYEEVIVGKKAPIKMRPGTIEIPLKKQRLVKAIESSYKSPGKTSP